MDDLKIQIDNTWKEIFEMDDHLDGVSPAMLRHGSSPSPLTAADDGDDIVTLGSSSKRKSSRKQRPNNGQDDRKESTEVLK